MPTGRKPVQPRRPRKPAARPSSDEADDLALAEEILRNSRKEHAAVVREWDKFMKSLALEEGRKPIGAKKLRERMIRNGLDPNGNEFSRGIIEMREE